MSLVAQSAFLHKCSIDFTRKYSKSEKKDEVIRELEAVYNTICYDNAGFGSDWMSDWKATAWAQQEIFWRLGSHTNRFKDQVVVGAIRSWYYLNRVACYQNVTESRIHWFSITPHLWCKNPTHEQIPHLCEDTVLRCRQILTRKRRCKFCERTYCINGWDTHTTTFKHRDNCCKALRTPELPTLPKDIEMLLVSFVEPINTARRKRKA